MTTKDIKLMIIQNFIEYYTTDEDERMDMIGVAQNYVDEDWVDEVAQSGMDRDTFVDELLDLMYLIGDKENGSYHLTLSEAIEVADQMYNKIYKKDEKKDT